MWLELNTSVWAKISYLFWFYFAWCCASLVCIVWFQFIYFASHFCCLCFWGMHVVCLWSIMCVQSDLFHVRLTCIEDVFSCLRREYVLWGRVVYQLWGAKCTSYKSLKHVSRPPRTSMKLKTPKIMTLKPRKSMFPSLLPRMPINKNMWTSSLKHWWNLQAKHNET